MTTTFKPGDRVSATVWGTRKVGTVDRIGRSGTIVFVRFDGSPRVEWMHAVSLTPETGETYYQREAIRPALSRLKRGDLSPRIVEAFLRVYHSTLDAFAHEDFEREIARLLPEIDADGPKYGERLAGSYGL